MTITDEQIKAVAVRMSEIEGFDPYEEVEFLGHLTITRYKRYWNDAGRHLLAAQAIRDVMGSDDDA